MEPTLLLSESEISDKTLDPFTFETAKTLFDSHGFLKIGNLFPREWIQTLADAFFAKAGCDPMKMAFSCGVKEYGSRVISIPLAPPFNQSVLYANPILLPLMKAFLGSDCVLGGLCATVAFPGGGEQPIHRDFEPLFTEQPFLTAVHAPFAIAVGIPLVDIDEVNGPTKIWSSTHRAVAFDKNEIDQKYERHLLCGPIGSCYFWDYRTYHAESSNCSKQLRPLLYLFYTRRWFRDLKNPDRMSPEAQEIPKEHSSLFLKSESLNKAKEESKIQALFEGERK
jgi:hypothetical protein